MLSPVRLISAFAVGVLLVGETVQAGGIICIANRCPHRKREFGDFGKNDLVTLDKRQNDPYSTVYALTSIPPWAGLPFSSCGGVSAGTTTICPVDHYCHCNSGTSRLCLPTSTLAGGAPAPTITSCSQYSGVMSNAQCQFTWSTTLTEMVSAYQQCGGYTSAILSEAWDEKTLCPVNYRCVATNFWYKQCIPNTSSYTLPSPSSYWACGGGYYPLATKEGMQCGGHCFKAAGKPDGQCPGTMSCWTRTYPKPGFEATCYSTSPPGGVWATSLCYPITYDWPGYGGPTCQPMTAQTQTPYGQCGGSTVNAYNSAIPWNGPQKCQCGYQCNTSSGAYYANCNAIPNFVNTCGPALGPGTQSLYGRCGGSIYVNNSLQPWTGSSMCQPGATCQTDPGGWYAQCTSIVARRQKRAPSPVPNAMPAPEPTASVPFVPVYQAAVPASRPRY